MDEDKNLDKIFGYVDDAFCDGRFDEVNNKIPEILDLSELELLAWLTTVSWAKLGGRESLSNHKLLYNKCLEFFSKEALKGLEP